MCSCCAGSVPCACPRRWPRKLVVRGGQGVQVEAFCPMEADSWEPEQVPPDVQLLRRECPVRLPKEMAEKSFSLDEELTLPESAPALQELIYYRLIPSVTDKKVLSGKAVFRGNAQVHVLYRSTEGQLHNWDFSLPFSQYAQLEQEHSPEAGTAGCSAAAPGVSRAPAQGDGRKELLPGRGADPAGIRPSPSGADLLPADPVGDGQEGSLREGGVPGQCAGARSLPQHRGAAP